jgi:hypothetical protein
LADSKLDINGADKEGSTFLGFPMCNITDMFQMLGYISTLTAVLGWTLVKISEKDNRFDGIDDTEGVVFISGNFSDEYEIDTERKPFSASKWPNLRRIYSEIENSCLDFHQQK